MTSQLPSTLPPVPAHIHFVGIGGIGMSGLARILKATGYHVSGSDANASDQTAALQADGIDVVIGHGDTASASAADLIVITAAVGAGNAEVDAARAVGVPVIKRAALLGGLANPRVCVAVAGSHGKSSTSGMLVTALSTLAEDPSYAVGAIVASTGVNAAPGGGRCFVVEADEYDRSFLQLTPDVAIITNIDYDHPDLFATTADYEAAFAAFVALMKPGGTLVLAGDDAACTRVGAMVTGETRVVTFGESGDEDFVLVDDRGHPAVKLPGGAFVALRLQVPGRHNARNATAALAALIALQHDPVAAAAALGTYTGVGRRFELVGELRGIVVVDDYAHHPREIIATIAAARERYPGRRIVAAFQPHTFSRTKALLGEFADALDGADVAAVLDIYAARERDSLGISAADLVERMAVPAIAAGTVVTAAERLAQVIAPGDVVLTLGAGDVTNLGRLLLGLLEEQEATAFA
jgi:UDP-N-acetylmuramate--alanine ligase